MRYIGPVFLAVAAILSALTLAIVGKSDQLKEYIWAAPYLVALIVLLVVSAVIVFIKSGLRQEKEKGVSVTLPVQANTQTVKQESNPIQNVYIGNAPAQSMPAVPTPKVEPNIKFVGTASVDVHSPDGDVFCEVR